MFKKIMLAGLMTGVLATGAPAAHAAAVTADCRFISVSQEQLTGGQDTYTGPLVCYAVSDTPGSTICVHGEVRVNGATVASTAEPQQCAPVSVSVSQLTYTATDSDTVTVCAVWTGSESGESCHPTTTQQIPPQEVIDLLTDVAEVVDAVLAPLYDFEETFIDPIVCPVLATIGTKGDTDVPGVLEIDEQGDIYVLGAPFWDCPPYGLFG